MQVSLMSAVVKIKLEMPITINSTVKRYTSRYDYLNHNEYLKNRALVVEPGDKDVLLAVR